MKLLNSYKANRIYDDSFLGGPFFQCSYKEDLFLKGGAKKIFSFPTLEADDCLAILTKNIHEKYPNANITIITSDMDYLQLAKDNICLYDLKFRKLTERKSSFNNAKKDLFVKILTGDKSDNIKGVFKKCGPKTACKYYENKESVLDTRNNLLNNIDKLNDLIDKDKNFNIQNSIFEKIKIGLPLSYQNLNNVSLNKKNNTTFILDGDGAIQMHMGNLITIAKNSKKNITHILFNNKLHESTGFHQLANDKIDYKMIFKACGYKKVYYVKKPSQLDKILKSKKKGLIAIIIDVYPGSIKNLPRPTKNTLLLIFA